MHILIDEGDGRCPAWNCRNELKVLHDALEAFIESGSSGLQDCECRLIYDRVHKILSWGPATTCLTGSVLSCRRSEGGREPVAGGGDDYPATSARQSQLFIKSASRRSCSASSSLSLSPARLDIPCSLCGIPVSPSPLSPCGLDRGVGRSAGLLLVFSVRHDGLLDSREQSAFLAPPTCPLRIYPAPVDGPHPYRVRGLLFPSQPRS